MKQIYLLIGIVVALMLCITPVAAVTGDDFEIVTDLDDMITAYTVNKYTYSNKNNPNEKYTEIYTEGTLYYSSLVTFKPVNIDGSPVMVVDTYRNETYIYLPRSVDDWEIKYYSRTAPIYQPDDEYLENAGVVNLNQFFGEYIRDGLILKLRWNQVICPKFSSWPYYLIPDVN